MPRYVNDVEREFKRLNMNPYSMFPTTGNRDYDRDIIEVARKYIVGVNDQIGFVSDLVDSSEYKNLPKIDQKIQLVKKTRLAVQLARQEVFMQRDGWNDIAVSEKWFNGLPKLERKKLTKIYNRATGKNIRETRDFPYIYREIFPKYELLLTPDVNNIEGFNTPIIY